MRIYVGFKEKKGPEIILSDKEPKKTDPQYDFIYGPFKTAEEASKYVKAIICLACGDG